MVYWDQYLDYHKKVVTNVKGIRGITVFSVLSSYFEQD